MCTQSLHPPGFVASKVSHLNGPAVPAALASVSCRVYPEWFFEIKWIALVPSDLHAWATDKPALHNGSGQFS